MKHFKEKKSFNESILFNKLTKSNTIFFLKHIYLIMTKFNRHLSIFPPILWLKFQLNVESAIDYYKTNHLRLSHQLNRIIDKNISINKIYIIQLYLFYEGNLEGNVIQSGQPLNSDGLTNNNFRLEWPKKWISGQV